MKNKIKAEAIANEICMNKRYHKGAIVLVEGSTDKILFNKFVDTKCCYIKDATGKQKVIKAIPMIKERKPTLKVFGIVDSDFYRLDGQNLNSNILTTDTHDIETMMIKTKALEYFMDEFANEEKLKVFFKKNSKNLRETLLEGSVWIGYLLWVSQKGFPLSFNELDFKKFVDNKNLKFNLDNFIFEILGKNGNCQYDAQALKAKLSEAFDVTHDKWQVCRGHDMIKILILGLQYIFGICDCKKLSEQELHDIIESKLIEAYDSSDFVKTELYDSIRRWETENDQITLNPNF
ncbi:MAG: DUF4435 domain-containing protein [Methanosarcina sp.]|jgi:5S rRNA maturation endonuclease (ribonuclease M5)